MSKVRKILPVLLSASVMAAAVMPVLTLSAAGSGIQDGYSWTMEDGGFYSVTSLCTCPGKRETISPVRVDGKEIAPSDQAPEIRMLYEGGDGNPDPGYQDRQQLRRVQYRQPEWYQRGKTSQRRYGGRRHECGTVQFR